MDTDRGRSSKRRKTPQERIDDPNAIVYLLLSMEIAIFVLGAIGAGFVYSQTHNPNDFITQMLGPIAAGAFVFVILGALYFRADKIQKRKQSEGGCEQ